MSMQTNTKNNKNKKSKSKNNNNNNKTNCNYCELEGHIEANCYKKYPEKRPKKKSINNTKESKKENILSSFINKDNSISNIDFILDSEATIHTCYIKELFTSIKSTNTSIKQSNTRNTIKASGIGNIELKFTSTNKLVKLQNVLYIPELGVNLLSLNLITSKGYNLSFNKDNCYINTSNKTLLTKGSYKEGVSVFSAISTKTSINTKVIKNKTLATLSTYSSTIEELEDSELDLIDSNLEESNIIEDSNLDKDLNIEKTIDLEDNLSKDLNSSNNNKEEEIVFNNNTIKLAYNRLEHINLKAIKQLLNNTNASFINLKDIDSAKVNLDNCIVCIQSKLTKNRSTKTSTKVEAYLDLIYIDIGGPITPKTFRGFKYYITFRDAFTRYLVIKLLKSRKDIVIVIENTITELELEAKDNTISISYNSNNSSNNNTSNSNTSSNNTSNNINNYINKAFNNNKVKALQLDNEFKSKELTSYLNKKGIKTRFSSPYTPKQNGAAEIINRVLFNKVRALLINSNLPKNLWGEAILTATYLYNRTPNSSIEFKTPYYLKYNIIPNIDNIRVFGSLIYNKEPSNFIKKLDSKATPYYLIGFVADNIYKLYNPSNNKSITSRDCKIIEGYFYKNNNNSNIQKIFTRIEDLSNKNNNKLVELDSSSEDDLTIPNNSKNNTIINKNRRSRRIIEEDYSKDELANNTSILIEDNSNNNTFNSILSTIETSNNRKDWKSQYNKLILTNLILNTSNSNLIEPKSFKEVLLRKDKDLYLKAMQIEIEDLLKSNTQDLVIKTNNVNIIKGRWVLSKKLNLDNTIKKYKARQVAKGFLQKYNINYKETFASTSKPSIIRLLLSITTYLDQEIYTWDIKQAFPNAVINKDNIYLQLLISLEEFILNKTLKELESKVNNLDNNLIKAIKQAIANKDYKNIICKLNKALYGLK